MFPSQIVEPGAGRTLRLLGIDHMLLVEGAATGGRLLLLRVVLPPGAGIPTHVHTREDEVFYVLEGTIEFRLGPHAGTAGAGTTIFGPRDLPHAVRATETGASILVAVLPAGLETMFEALSRLPPGPPDLARVAQIAGEYGISFVA